MNTLPKEILDVIAQKVKMENTMIMAFYRKRYQPQGPPKQILLGYYVRLLNQEEGDCTLYLNYNDRICKPIYIHNLPMFVDTLMAYFFSVQFEERCITIVNTTDHPPINFDDDKPSPWDMHHETPFPSIVITPKYHTVKDYNKRKYKMVQDMIPFFNMFFQKPFLKE